MAFHNVQFPTDISYGSAGGPGFSTKVVELASGAEQRVAQWGQAQRKYDVSYGVKSVAQLSNLQQFYLAREGAAHGFRFKDFLDYTSKPTGNIQAQFFDVQLGTATGANSQNFQLIKRYVSGGTTHVRTITKPVANTVMIGVNGVQQDPSTPGIQWGLDAENGIVVVEGLSANDIVTAGFEFDVPVRFSSSADQLLSFTYEDFSGGSASVELIEIIGESGTTPQDFFYGGYVSLGALNADATLSLSGGRVVEIAPTATHSVNFPTPTNLPGGGPYFYVLNTGSAAATLQTTPAHSLAAGAMAMVVLSVTGTGTKVWKVCP